MKKSITNLSLAIFMIAVVLAIASCSKEDMQADDCAQSVPQAMVSGALQYGAFTGTPLIEFRRSKSLSKTYFAPHLAGSNYDTLFSTAKDFPFNSTANTYNIMKVWRTSEPGKFFWIMLENFKYKPGDSSYVYGNDESNAQLYGRMYHWTIAKQCENKIMKYLPRRRLDGSYTTDTFPTYGHLPTVQDIHDLMEVSYPNLLNTNQFTGTTLYDTFGGEGYYDAFISGRPFYDADYNDSTYYHTLAGWLDNTDFYWLTHRDYCDLHEQVCFWTDTEWTSLPSTHFPFEIHYQNGNFVACLPVGAANNYGYYVRYVFEPKQLNY